MAHRTRTPPAWLETALFYARAGWYVAPLHPRRASGCGCGLDDCLNPVHPLFEQWRAEATREAAAIRSWGDLKDVLDLGALCGGYSDLVIVRAPRHPTGQLPGLLAPSTPTAWFTDETHQYLLFRHPGLPLPAQTTLNDDVVVYGDDALVRLPPYLWARPDASERWRESPELTPVAPLPQSLVHSLGLPKVADAPPGPGPALHFRRASELYLPERPDWLIPGWVARGTLTLVSGEPVLSGKTSLALDLAAAIGHGRPFRESVAVSTSVVLVTENRGSALTRLLRVSGLYNCPRLRLITYEDATGYSWQALIKETERWCLEHDVGLLVIDSIDTFASPTDDVAGTLRRLSDPLSVIATKRTYGDTPKEEINDLGELGAAAGVLIRLRTAPGTRIAEIQNRLDASEHHVMLARKDGAPEEATYPPLFTAAEIASA